MLKHNLNKIFLVQTNFNLIKPSFLKFQKRNYVIHGEKILKWYWREVFYDMFHNDIYKNYLIKRRDKEIGNNSIKSKIKSIFTDCLNTQHHMELLPLDKSGNPSYDSCLIWLYDGDNIEMFIEYLLDFNNFPPRNFKIVFYRAPFNPITFDSAILQRSWFNIFNLPTASGQRDINKKEIEKFNKGIQKEIKNQYNILGDYQKIYIGGFSQSACMALYATFTSKENLGGCVAFSGFNFDFTPLDLEKKHVPILCVNGSKDEVVILRHAINSYSNLIKLGFNINFIEEPGLGHFFTKTGLKNADNLLLNK